MVTVEVTLVIGRANPPPQPVTIAAAPSEASASNISCARFDHCFRKRLGMAKRRNARTGDPMGQIRLGVRLAALKAAV
jgi:hypothetical protein